MFHKVVLHPAENYMELFERYYVPGIRGVYGVKSRNFVEFQALLFDSKKYSEKQAKDWCEKHSMKIIEFIPAEVEITPETVPSKKGAKKAK
ncbi:MAG: hypothetical protein A2Y53_04870 [Chloroflexi bacterium RBG_16_47_49]|nr:MAG: hypothetical protein A2Y53_04870 [Chloroflexi bacterium RBG_16_47_49]